MRLSQRCSCFYWVWRSNLILTILSGENTSNFWEINFWPQMWMKKWCQSYCRRSEFHCLIKVIFSAMVSCFLLDSFELQEMVCLTKQGANFSSLNISRRTQCSGYDEHARDTIIFSWWWKLKNQSLKLIVITFCKKRPSCDHVIKQCLVNLSSQTRW